MFNWLRQAAGAVGNLFNQGSRYVGNTFNNADRQRRIWEQQARQAAPQVQRQVQQQVQQLPKPPQVDFSAVIKNLQALRNQPQVNNAIRAANPINQFKSQANAIQKGLNQPIPGLGVSQRQIAAQLPMATKQTAMGAKKVGETFFGGTGQVLNTAKSLVPGSVVLTVAPYEIAGKALGIKPLEDRARQVRNQAFADYSKQSQTGVIPMGSQVQKDIDSGGIKGLKAFTGTMFNKGTKAGLEIAPVVTGTAAGVPIRTALLRGGTTGAAGNFGYSMLNDQYKNKTAQEKALQFALDVGGGYGGELLGAGIGKLAGKVSPKTIQQGKSYTGNLLDEMNTKFRQGKIDEKQFRAFVVDDFTKKNGRMPMPADVDSFVDVATGRMNRPYVEALRQKYAGNQPQLPVGTRIADTAPKNPLDALKIEDRLKSKYPGVDFSVYDNGRTINVSKIVVPKTARNSGIGTKAMQEIISEADRSGKTITLTPSSDYGGSKVRLKEFYKRLGFVENKGRTKDLAISEDMYRLPTNKSQGVRDSLADGLPNPGRKPIISDADPLEALKAEARQATGARSDYSPENLQANRQIRAKNASSITYADKKAIKPDELVTVYRAVPGKAKGGLTEGDWVTPNKEQARLFMKQSWAQDDTGAKIVTKKVKASELRYHADDAKGYVDDELLYVPKSDPLEALKQEARKYKSAEDYLTAKLGGYNQIYDKNLGSRVITTTKGNIRYTIKESGDSIKLFKLLADKKGTGVGDDLVKSLKDYSDATGKPLVINTPNKFWDRYDWLKKMPNGRDLEYKPTDLYNQATKNKPIYETAPKPDAQVPVKANRGLIESVKESPMTKSSLRNALESEQYTVLPNKVTMDQAVKTINKNPQAALNEVLSTKPRTAQLNAQGLILAEKAQKRGDFETAQQIFKAMAPGNTKEGQAIQILSVWSKTKPEGVVKYAQKVVDDANNTLIVAGKNPSITLSADKAANFRKQAEAISKMADGKDKLIATQKMLNEIHQQVPASMAEKAQSLLYYTQLLNPKTAVRNIIGNTGFALGETAKDIVGAPIDIALTGARRLIGQDAKRSIYFPNPIKQVRAGLAGGAEAAKEARFGVNLSGLEGQLQIGNKQPAFRNPVGRGLDKAMQFELSVPDRTFYTSRYQQTLDNLMKGAKVSKPTKEMLDIADYDAKYATFQDDSIAAQAFMKIKQGLNANKDFGIGSFVINYPKTPGNLLARGIDYSPAGFVKSTLEIAKPLFGQGPFNQKKFIDSFSRALVGTGSLVGTGALLHKAGIITGAPSKDKDVNAQDKATGLGAYRINVDALRRYVTSGFKPQKLEDGDRTLTYDWFQPAAIGISMGANIDETQASDKGAVGKLVSMLGTGGASIAAGAETLANQPLVQGLTKLTGNGGGITQGVLAIAQGVPASFVPTLLNQVNQLVDNTSRSTYDPNPAVQGINMVKAKIPGLAQTLQPQVNPEGQNNERYQNGSNTPLNVFLNPAFMGTYNADNVQKEITRLENSTGQTSQYPSIIKNTQKINGQDVQLSPQQVTDMQRVQGQLTKEAYAKIMSDPAYSRLSDTDKVKKLQNIITQANQIARSRVLSDQNGKDQITVTAEGKKPKVAKAKKPKKGRTTKAKKGRRARVAKAPKLPSIRLSAPRKVATAKVAKLRSPKVRYPRLAKSSKTPRIKV